MFKQPRENPALGVGKTGTGTKSRHSSLGMTSRASSIDRDGQANGETKTTRVLRIRRQAVSVLYVAYAGNETEMTDSQADGTWTTEIVRNDNVISAYVARRVEIEEENMKAEDYVPTGDVAKDQRMKAKYVLTALAYTHKIDLCLIIDSWNN